MDRSHKIALGVLILTPRLGLVLDRTKVLNALQRVAFLHEPRDRIAHRLERVPVGSQVLTRVESAPWPGMTIVEASMTASAAPEAAIIPSMEPPVAVSMNGKRSRKNVSPMWTTFARRKCTMASPSV